MAGVPAWADDIATDRAALYRTYGAELDKLGAALEKQGLAEPARQVKTWLPPHRANTIVLFVLPERAEWSLDAEAAAPTWLAQFRALREAQAEAIFTLARRAADAERSSLAMELVREAVHENPDHKLGRRLLGFVHKGAAWYSPHAIHELGAGKVWNSRFGWLPKEHVARYEAGERFYRNHWISGEEDRRLHADIKQGWQVETAHYQVTTNHSLEAGVEMAERLEQLHDFWETLFIGCLEPPAALARRFAGKGVSPRDARKHEVVMFRNREQYNAALIAIQPNIGISLGVYFDDQEKAYFFAGEQQQAGTIYHEATHQLFQETRAVPATIGKKGNFWIAEGIACYMESLSERQGDYYTLGGPEAGRLPAARKRLLIDKFYIPLGELVDYTDQRLQRDSNVSRLYTESAGLATFLMHYRDGQYRPALVAYLDALYADKTQHATLANLANATYDELDRQYREFLLAR